MSKVKIILQARTLSYRLLAKSLLPICEIPLAVLCAKRLGNTGIPVTVVIPKEKTDDALYYTLKKFKINVIRGHHTDVISRYVKVAKTMLPNDIIIRATADNPLPDGSFVEEMVKIFKNLQRNYMCTHNKYFKLPYGLAIQLFKSKDLIRISKKKLTKFDKEHVIVGLAKDKINTKLKGNILKYKQFYTDKKLSIDTLQDYIRVEKLFRNCKQPIKIKWQKIIKR